MEDVVGLHSLRPADGATSTRKRVGRGPGSGHGKRSGRGQKGQKSRSGSHMPRPGFEGGQMPLYMRVGKLRGSTKKMSMPMGPFRTQTHGVNVDSLARFDAGTTVTPELLLQAGLVRNLKHPVKILGRGELTVALHVQADGFSASARTKLEEAGGTVTLLGPTEAPAPASAKERANARSVAAASAATRTGTVATTEGAGDEA